MYRYIAIAIIIALLPSGVVLAQKNILKDKVEVTKSYQHHISRASKRDIKPTKEDSVSIEIPTLEYSISHKPDQYPFTLTQLNTPKYKTEIEKMYGGYADLYLGAPLSTSATVAYTSIASRTSISGVSFSHNGFWANLEDAKGDSQSAPMTENNLSAYFEYEHDKFRTRIMVDASYDSFSRYGYSSILDSLNATATTPYSNSPSHQYFLRGNLIAEIGTPFKDVEELNINFYTRYGVIIDKFGFDESIYQFGTFLQKGVAKLNSIAQLNLEYLSIVPTRQFVLYETIGKPLPYDNPPLDPNGIETDNYKYSPSGYLGITPKYIFDYKGFNITAGALFNFNFNAKDINYKQSGAVIIPKAKASISVLDGAATAYAALDGEYIVNNYYTLTEMNPYIVEGLTAPNTTLYKYYAGISGTIASSFIYNINLGIRDSHDMVMFVNSEGGNVFRAITGDYTNVETNIELGYKYRDILSLEFDLQHINYNRDTDNITALNGTDIVLGHAPLTVDFRASVMPTDRLSLTLGVKSLSERIFAYTYKDILITYKTPSVVDLSFLADYKVTERINAMFKGTNLLNQALYQYSNYRGIGINLMVGVSYKFN